MAKMVKVTEPESTICTNPRCSCDPCTCDPCLCNDVPDAALADEGCVCDCTCRDCRGCDCDGTCGSSGGSGACCGRGSRGGRGSRCGGHGHGGHHGHGRILLLVVLGLAAAAVVKELSKPQDQRTWNGFVASVVPYDFRLPTLDKAKATYWNPDGAAVSPKLFGIGWDPNLGRIITDIKTLAGR